MKIDLLQKPEEMTSPAEVNKEGYYPSFTFTTKEAHDLPDEGDASFHFKKISSTEEEHDGKTTYRCTVEVQSISDVSEGKADKSDDAEPEGDTEEAAETDEEETAEPKTKRSPGVAAVLNRKGY